MLKRENRLVSTYEFNKTRRLGSSFVGKYSRVFCLKNRDSLLPTRIGIVITKKFDKSAVNRNRIKRIFREILRKDCEKMLSGFWVVVHPRKDFIGASYEEISTDLTALLQKASVLG